MENSTTGKYLERIQIEGLWGRVDVDWHLHPDVNILVGENGTGKSTVLQLAASGLSKSFKMTKELGFNTVLLTVDGALYKSTEKNASWQLTGGRAGHKQPWLDGQKPEGIYMNYINTFEFIPSAIETNSNGTSKTNLDQQLDLVTRQYLAYQSKQSSKVFSKKATFEEAFAQKSYLFETLNRLFSSTGKTVDEQEGELEFLIDGTERIHRNDLSSGEKQLLVILLTVLFQEGKPAILLMDEPEISLHLRWQYELIEIIRTLNPNCQVIIATHSPSIFNDGWRDKVFWMENIVHKAVSA